MNDITPTQVAVWFWRWFWIGVCAIALLAAVTLGLWRAHWWFFAQGQQMRYNGIVHSQQYHDSHVALMQQHISNISGLATDRATVAATSYEQVVLRAQQMNEIQSLCQESTAFFPNGTPADAQLEVVIQANCIAGAPTPQPPLADPVPPGEQ